MSVKKRGLGRGLGELLSSQVTTEVADSDLRMIPIDRIQPGRYQPRDTIESQALQELSDSIRAQGVLQPIVVRTIAPDQYEIIAGERRWRAAKLAGLTEIPAILKDVDDQTALCLAIIENIQREQLNPAEEAKALKRLIEEFALTHQQAAEAVGKSRVAVTNFLRLNNLHPIVMQMLEQNELEMGHAKALLGLSVLENQLEAARIVVNKGLSVRDTESLVRHMQQEAISPQKKSIDPDILRLQKKLSETLGAKVMIHHKPSGKGRLTILYHDLEQLEGILEHLN